MARPKLQFQRRFKTRQKLIHFIDLLVGLVERNMKIMYKRSVLGIAWTLVKPVLQLIVFTLVFKIVLSIQIENYSSFIFVGLLTWNWFQNSLFQSIGAIISNRALIRQPNFPNGILPIVVITTGLVHFLLSLPVFIVFSYIDGIALKPTVLLLPVLAFIQFVFIASLAYPLAALNVTYRDVQHTLGILLQFQFYMSGVFYDISRIPEESRWVFNLNPMVNIIEAYRDILIRGVVPEWNYLLIILAISATVMFLSYRKFEQQSGYFLEEI